MASWWAFWRRDDSRTEPRASRDGEDDAADPNAALKVRARRRLIGAAALLLAVVVFVPMLLDPAPRPIPDNIPIDMPSERSAFKPRLALPPLPEPPAGADEAPGGAKGEAGRADAARADAGAPEAAKPGEADAAKGPAAGTGPEARPADPASEKAAEPAKAAGRTETRKAAEARKPAEPPRADAARTEPPKGEARKSGERVFVQVAALGSDLAAQDLVDKLRKGGVAAFSERVDARSGPLYRVRVGPFGSREEAERTRVKLAEIGVSSSIVATVVAP